MSKLFKNIYEHLKTRKKYNTLQLKLEVVREDLERKQVELNTERRIRVKEKEVWEQKLKEQEEEIIKLKKKKVSNDSNSKKDK